MTLPAGYSSHMTACMAVKAAHGGEHAWLSQLPLNLQHPRLQGPPNAEAHQALAGSGAATSGAQAAVGSGGGGASSASRMVAEPRQRPSR